MGKWLLPMLGMALQAQLLTNPVQDYINKTALLNNILSNMRAAPGGGGGTADAPPAVSATLFTHAGSALLPAQLAGKAGPEAALAALVALYEQTARKDGFPANDLAYALEYFVVNTYLTYHDLHNVAYEKDPWARRGKDGFDRIAWMGKKKAMQVTAYQERAVFEQFRRALGGHAGVRQMTDRQKQEMSELLAIAFGMNFRAYMEAIERTDDGARDAARRRAKEHLEKLTGAPVERIVIDATGLRY